MSDRVGSRRALTGQRGQALVETALVIPILLLITFGVIGVGRVTQAQMGVSAVAREAARAAALADDPAGAAQAGLARGREVAAGYNLANGPLHLAIDPGTMARGASITASASYEVDLGDLPLLGWARVSVSSTHLERIDLYRSRWSSGG